MSQVLGAIIIFLGILISMRGLSGLVASLAVRQKREVNAVILFALLCEALICIGGFIMWLGFRVVGAA